MTKSISLSLYVLMAAFVAWTLVSSHATGVHWAQNSSGEIAAPGDLPNVAIETSSGARTTFAATNGHVRIATMFYAHCPGVCPMTLGMLRRIDARLSEGQRSQLNFVLLSLDPARDSPDELRKIGQGPRWLVGRTSEADARSFASAAHIQYRNLSDGSIDHSTALILLDRQGRILARANEAGDSDFVATVRQALK
jgi:protein SCO1